MDPEADNPLRVVIPDLVPDPEFVGMLAARAAASRGSATPPLAWPGLGVRVAAAAAGVVLVIAGAAITAANLAGDDSAPAPTVPGPSATQDARPRAKNGHEPRDLVSSPKPPVDRGGPPAGTLDEGPDDPGPSSTPSSSPGPSDMPDTCAEWLAMLEEQGYIDDADDYVDECEEYRNQHRNPYRGWDRGWDRDSDGYGDGGYGSRHNDDLGREPRVNREEVR